MALQMLQERITTARNTKFEGQEISRDRIDHLHINGMWSSKLPWLILNDIGFMKGGVDISVQPALGPLRH